MFTAILQLSTERINAFRFSHQLLKFRNCFHSKITVKRGNSKPFDISIDSQLKELAVNGSSDLQIVIEGIDEIKAACTLINFVSHGMDI